MSEGESRFIPEHPDEKLAEIKSEHTRFLELEQELNELEIQREGITLRWGEDLENLRLAHEFIGKQIEKDEEWSTERIDELFDRAEKAHTKADELVAAYRTEARLIGLQERYGKEKGIELLDQETVEKKFGSAVERVMEAYEESGQSMEGVDLGDLDELRESLGLSKDEFVQQLGDLMELSHTAAAHDLYQEEQTKKQDEDSKKSFKQRTKGFLGRAMTRSSISMATTLGVGKGVALGAVAFGVGVGTTAATVVGGVGLAAPLAVLVGGRWAKKKWDNKKKVQEYERSISELLNTDPTERTEDQKKIAERYRDTILDGIRVKKAEQLEAKETGEKGANWEDIRAQYIQGEIKDKSGLCAAFEERRKEYQAKLEKTLTSTNTKPEDIDRLTLQEAEISAALQTLYMTEASLDLERQVHQAKERKEGLEKKGKIQDVLSRGTAREVATYTGFGLGARAFNHWAPEKYRAIAYGLLGAYSGFRLADAQVKKREGFNEGTKRAKMMKRLGAQVGGALVGGVSGASAVYLGNEARQEINDFLKYSYGESRRPPLGGDNIPPPSPRAVEGLATAPAIFNMNHVGSKIIGRPDAGLFNAQKHTIPEAPEVNSTPEAPEVADITDQERIAQTAEHFGFKIVDGHLRLDMTEAAKENANLGKLEQILDRLVAAQYVGEFGETLDPEEAAKILNMAANLRVALESGNAGFMDQWTPQGGDKLSQLFSESLEYDVENQTLTIKDSEKFEQLVDGLKAHADDLAKTGSMDGAIGELPKNKQETWSEIVNAAQKKHVFVEDYSQNARVKAAFEANQASAVANTEVVPDAEYVPVVHEQAAVVASELKTSPVETIAPTERKLPRLLDAIQRIYQRTSDPREKALVGLWEDVRRYSDATDPAQAHKLAANRLDDLEPFADQYQDVRDMYTAGLAQMLDGEMRHGEGVFHFGSANPEKLADFSGKLGRMHGLDEQSSTIFVSWLAGEDAVLDRNDFKRLGLWASADGTVQKNHFNAQEFEKQVDEFLSLSKSTKLPQSEEWEPRTIHFVDTDGVRHEQVVNMRAVQVPDEVGRFYEVDNSGDKQVATGEDSQPLRYPEGQIQKSSHGLEIRQDLVEEEGATISTTPEVVVTTAPAPEAQTPEGSGAEQITTQEPTAEAAQAEAVIPIETAPAEIKLDFNSDRVVGGIITIHENPNGSYKLGVNGSIIGVSEYSLKSSRIFNESYLDKLKEKFSDSSIDVYNAKRQAVDTGRLIVLYQDALKVANEQGNTRISSILKETINREINNFERKYGDVFSDNLTEISPTPAVETATALPTQEIPTAETAEIPAESTPVAPVEAVLETPSSTQLMDTWRTDLISKDVTPGGELTQDKRETLRVLYNALKTGVESGDVDNNAEFDAFKEVLRQDYHIKNPDELGGVQAGI
ncbi:hypothetical protein BK004_04400 [bacterium CG10_46_32]|nr:MAG: hypothetical protein BK004_04400 [bacterium CG10_46_32]